MCLYPCRESLVTQSISKQARALLDIILPPMIFIFFASLFSSIHLVISWHIIYNSPSPSNFLHPNHVNPSTTYMVQPELCSLCSLLSRVKKDAIDCREAEKLGTTIIQ